MWSKLSVGGPQTPFCVTGAPLICLHLCMLNCSLPAPTSAFLSWVGLGVLCFTFTAHSFAFLLGWSAPLQCSSTLHPWPHWCWARALSYTCPTRSGHPQLLGDSLHTFPSPHEDGLEKARHLLSEGRLARMPLLRLQHRALQTPPCWCLSPILHHDVGSVPQACKASSLALPPFPVVWFLGVALVP